MPEGFNNFQTRLGHAFADAELLRQALRRVSVKDSVGEVALATGRPRREVYQRALILARDAVNDRK